MSKIITRILGLSFLVAAVPFLQAATGAYNYGAAHPPSIDTGGLSGIITWPAGLFAQGLAFTSGALYLLIGAAYAATGLGLVMQHRWARYLAITCAGFGGLLLLLLMIGYESVRNAAATLALCWNGFTLVWLLRGGASSEQR